MANYFKEFAQQNGNVVLLDAGNFAASQGRQQRLLTEYFMRGMKRMNYSAVLVAANEMKYGTAFLLKANKEAGLPLLSSNILSKEGKFLFKEKIIFTYKDLEWVVIGLSDNIKLDSNDIKSCRVIPPDSAAVMQMSRIRKSEKTVIVLLTNMREEMLRKVLKENPGIDIVVHADHPEFREQPGQIEKSIVVSHGHQTKNAHSLDFNWAKGRVTEPSGTMVALDTKYEKNTEMDPVFKEYEAALGKTDFRWPRPANVQKIYAGQGACLACHPRETESEKAGPHHKAFAVLEKENQTHNPLCLECHVTGLERENGFWDIETSEDMTGVQCEQCHGPLQNHVQEENKFPLGGAAFAGALGSGGNDSKRQYKPRKTDFYICTRCHTDKYKLSVSPEDAWKKIGHSKK